MKNIFEVENLKNKKVLLRLDLNVPVRGGVVINDFRIKKSLPTINFLKERGARVIIISHIGREREDTLKPVFEKMKNFVEISFSENIVGDDVTRLVENMKDGDVLMLENLRQDEGEKSNSESFSKQLAELGDIYVNDAFSNSHRMHSSIVGVPQFLPSYSGILFNKEVKHLSKSFDPQSPSLLILGGNKFETKLKFVEKFLNIFDHVFIGGALANDLYKSKGLNVGNSLVSKEEINLESVLNNEKVILPVDVVVRNSEGDIIEKKPEEVLDDEKILDAGGETVSQLEELIGESNFVLFNGPLGDYESGFGGPTEKLINAIANSSAVSIAGGGDSTAIINELGIEEDFTFVSTGGGAMLEFLLNETLPGIEALK